VLGETNDLTMHILVIIHAWMGHVHLFTNNVWHDETERETCLQRMAQDASFVRSLVDDQSYGWDKYEYYADACHALELHSGELPTNKDMPSDDELRDRLKQQLQLLQDQFTQATTEPDKRAIANDIRDTVKLLSCHPIVPTGDILGFFSKEGNCNGITEKERRLAELTRFENRWSTQVIGRTKMLHEGVSHWVDRRMPLEPEMEFHALGFDRMLDVAKYDTMHDAWPIYIYSDPYDLGEAIIDYIDETHSRKIGTETVRYKKLYMLTAEDAASGKWQPETIETAIGPQVWEPAEGDIVELDEWAEKTVDKWDRSFLLEVMDTYDDYRLFSTFLTDDFFERLHKKSLKWVNKMVMLINKTLKDHRWDPSLVFEGDNYPRTLEEQYVVVSTWMNQIQMQQWMGWFGFGAPTFPVSDVTLWQMLQIIQTIFSYDTDKVEFKRQMMLRTGLLASPNIKIVDTGKFNKAPQWTLRHEYDTDFGPLKPSTARKTMREHYKYSGPVRLLTMQILRDMFGRAWGPPRPYQYATSNGTTVKEKWLSS